MYKDSFASGEFPAAPASEHSLIDNLRGSRLAALFSALVSLALLIAIALEIRGMDLGRIVDMIPASPLFWLVFVAWYVAGPASEWIIYRRLWRIPGWGFGALLRKMVSNELLLGYLGEAQFYAWARSRTHLTATPFGAIKDVAILSAFCGNLVSIAMLALALPLLSEVASGGGMRSAFVSLGVVLVSSFLMLLLRHRLFSLPGPDLRFIALVHFARCAAKAGLGALLWYLVLPQVPVTLWLVLSTLRLLVSRLPLLPNKEVVFAGLAVVLLGQHVAVASLLTLIAGLVVLAHIGIGGSFAAADLFESWKRR